MASSAALFQSVTTSAFAGVPMLDVRFMAPTQAAKRKVLKKAFIGGLLSTKSGSVVRHRRHWRQAYSDCLFLRCAAPSHSIGSDFLALGARNSRCRSAR